MRERRFSSLSLPPVLPGGRLINPMRRQMIDEAVAWRRGSDTDHPEFTVVYKSERWEARVGKPGKEFDRDAEKRNENDMLPALFRGRTDQQFIPTMERIYRDLWAFKVDPVALEVVGSLLYRSAFLLDHSLTEGVWRWNPPADALAFLEAAFPAIPGEREDIPVRSYLQLIELLALQEDVKYWTLRGTVTRTGRQNTLFTLALVAAAAGSRVHPATVMYDLSRRRGVASLTPAEAVDAFPELTPLPATLTDNGDRIAD